MPGDVLNTGYPHKTKHMKTLPKTKIISVEGNVVEYVATGSGSPVIVLINGAGGPIHGWQPVFAELAKLTSVFAYNRAGIGRSSKPTSPQTGLVLVETLRASLLKTGLAPPFILVGHSLGGLIVNLFVRTYPHEVAGAVFLDATAPEDVATMAAYESRPQRILKQLLDLVFGKATYDEAMYVQQTVALIEQSPAFPDIPVVVVSGGKPALTWLTPAPALAARAENQRRLACLSPRGKQIIAKKSGHFPQFSEPAVVIEAVRNILRRNSVFD
ncbi:MAG: alpha/beta hydrolase [Chloroflexota bacterium]